MTNTYSKRWFEVFGDAVDAAQTDREVEFILCMLAQRVAPIRILDVCCGAGRHANRLAAKGCEVIGVEIDGVAVKRARQSSIGGAVFKPGDMRDLPAVVPVRDQPFDAVICMWQSFGHFGDDENQRVLRDMASMLSTGGLLLLDVYNPRFFENRLGARRVQRGAQTVIETKAMHDHRLTVTLNYGDGVQDRFRWRLYGLDEWRFLGETLNVRLVRSCTTFNESTPPSNDQPRMQLAFVKLRSDTERNPTCRQRC